MSGRVTLSDRREGTDLGKAHTCTEVHAQEDRAEGQPYGEGPDAWKGKPQTRPHLAQTLRGHRKSFRY